MTPFATTRYADRNGVLLVTVTWNEESAGAGVLVRSRITVTERDSAREIYSLEELVENFDYHHMSKSPAVFDIQKLRWMNGEYIKAMDFDSYAERAIPQIRKTISKDIDVNKIARSPTW